MQKTSIFTNSLIWFGAAISIAEILTGALIAPLGFEKGLLAIVLGHIIGCSVLYFAGLIGANTKKSAMDTVKMSFGQRGSWLFSSLNIMQLIGWTAVMIVIGATAANSITNLGGQWIWAIIIGGLIIVWIFIGIKHVSKINLLAMLALFILTILLSNVIFGGVPTNNFTADGSISFGTAVELSATMPLSWLPLISDYTRSAQKPKQATVASVLVYFIVSCWMYAIGLGSTIFIGDADIAKIMLGAGLGIIGLFVVVFSTVTTAFLDAYSAGVSSESISAKLRERPTAIVISIIGVILAIFASTNQYEHFLYFIGSVFAPMTAILLTNYFILDKDHSAKNFDVTNLVIWLIGFIIYRLSLDINTPVGNTLPVMLITGALCFVANKFINSKQQGYKC